MRQKIGWMFALMVVTLSSAEAAEKRVLMIINEGFYASEYFEPREIFDRAGFKVTVAAKYAGLIAPDRRNTGIPPVRAVLDFDQVRVSDYDAITFAGGNGAWTDYFPNETLHRILDEAMKRNGFIVGLLCSSTGLLGVANNLSGQKTPIAQGRHVTGYYRVEGLLRNLGKVNYDPGEQGKPYVVVDGNLITGRDPISAKLFGETVAKKIASGIVSR